MNLKKLAEINTAKETYDEAHAGVVRLEKLREKPNLRVRFGFSDHVSGQMVVMRGRLEMIDEMLSPAEQAILADTLASILALRLTLAQADLEKLGITLSD